MVIWWHGHSYGDMEACCLICWYGGMVSWRYGDMVIYSDMWHSRFILLITTDTGHNDAWAFGPFGQKRPKLWTYKSMIANHCYPGYSGWYQLAKPFLWLPIHNGSLGKKGPKGPKAQKAQAALGLQAVLLCSVFVSMQKSKNILLTNRNQSFHNCPIKTVYLFASQRQQ